MATVNWSLQHKRDTAANWTANNPTLLAGQLGIETDGLTTTPKFKIGDGVTAWNTLPYFYGGSASAQDLNNVLTVGNTTSGQDIVLTDDDKLQIGSTAGRYIGYDTNLIQIGLGIVNTNSNDHIILQDGGGIHVDTTKVILEQLTASRLLSLNANKEVVNETGTGFLKLTAGVISYDNSSYQPLDSDLTSWAGVTRASGFDTFTATPSSANLRALLTDKTGTGVNVFGTSPTFTTDITTPKVIGTAAQKSLTLTTASTASSSLGVGVQFDSTLNASANNDVTYGMYVSPTFTNGAYTGVTNYAAGFGYGIFITSSKSTGSGLYGINVLDSASAAVNCGGGVRFSGSYTGNTPTLAAAIDAVKDNATGGDFGFGLRFQTRRNGDGNTTGTFKLNGAGQASFTPLALSSGTTTDFAISIAAHSGQTASTESSSFKVTGNTKTWAAGALATQRFNWFSANTAAAASASTFTAIHNFYSDAPVAGSNMTATNLYAAGFGGHVFIANSAGVPSNNPTGGGILYVESGALKYRGSSGTITTLGAA